MSKGITRRQLLAAAAISSTGLIMSKGVFAESPSKKVTRVGFIGVGARGTFLLDTTLCFPNIEVPAVCDIDVNAAKRAQDLVEAKTGKRPTAYAKDGDDWKNLCNRDDLDAVIIATPWELHAQQAIAAMRTNKFVGLEVPACQTVEEGWNLIKTSEETGMPCMLLENVNYFQNCLSVTRMVSEGVLGNVYHALIGYIHDIRNLAFKEDGTLTWRGEHMATKNGNLYPTHPMGPTAWWMNINRGDRFVRLTSMSTKSQCLRDYAIRKFGADHPLAKRNYALGDTNTTMLETANGSTVTIYFDLCSPRPSDFIFRIHGTKGCYEGNRDMISLEGITPAGQWEGFSTSYQQKYEHPIWKDLSAEAVKNGGHGGCDYIIIHQFLKAVRGQMKPPIDVYDAVTWSAIVPLSIQSVAHHGRVVEFPDFTNGKWKTNPKLPITGA